MNELKLKAKKIRQRQLAEDPKKKHEIKTEMQSTAFGIQLIGCVSVFSSKNALIFLTDFIAIASFYVASFHKRNV